MTGGKYIPIGKLGKPHGISGAFRFSFHREPKSKRNLPKHFFIPSKGGIVPFFVSNIEMRGFDDGLINFEDITNPETAKLYTTKELYLTEAEVEKWFKKNSSEFDYLPGYMVNDAKLGDLGTVKEVIMALSPTIEGDTTIFYVSKKLVPQGVKVTTIARGISFGGELEYADEMTLARSIATRQPYENVLVKGGQ